MSKKDNTKVDGTLAEMEQRVWDAAKSIEASPCHVRSWQHETVTRHPHSYLVLIETDERTLLRGILSFDSKSSIEHFGSIACCRTLELVGEVKGKYSSGYRVPPLVLPDGLKREIVLRSAKIWAADVVTCEVSNCVTQTAKTPWMCLCAEIVLASDLDAMTPLIKQLAAILLRAEDGLVACPGLGEHEKQTWVKPFVELYGKV